MFTQSSMHQRSYGYLGLDFVQYEGIDFRAFIDDTYIWTRLPSTGWLLQFGLLNFVTPYVDSFSTPANVSCLLHPVIFGKLFNGSFPK